MSYRNTTRLKNLNTVKIMSVSFPVVVVILSRINNYSRKGYSRLTPNYDPPSYTSRDEEEEDDAHKSCFKVAQN